MVILLLLDIEDVPMDTEFQPATVYEISDSEEEADRSTGKRKRSNTAPLHKSVKSVKMLVSQQQLPRLAGEVKVCF